MNLKHQVAFLCLSLLVFESSCFTEFEISVPSGTVTGVYGEPLILPCTFSVDGSWDLNSTLVVWQHVGDIIHSFYVSQNQLNRQNPLYAKRTSLFNQEITQGNASLRLDKITLEDAGMYTCSISTNAGRQEKSFGVHIAAFYSEPRLKFICLIEGFTLLITSEGGYPSPFLQWLKENSEDITTQTQTDITHDIQTGLYQVSSRINLTEVTNSSLTFILHNKLLGQDIRREIQLYSDKREKRQESVYRCHGCVTLIPAVLLLVLIIISLMIAFIKNRRTKQNTFIGKEFKLVTKALNGKLPYDDQSNI
ncbi:CD276 antigen-like [Paramisgurnus dabryanus]|uniref:CD276 antigen-like n=1 Tax=Paramisgurnus dabryanus TaxID=90735 RepID=UPI0031F3682C